MIAKRRRTGRFAALNMDFPHTVATSVGLEGWGGVAGTQDGAVEPIQRPILFKAEPLCFEPQDLCESVFADFGWARGVMRRSFELGFFVCMSCAGGVGGSKHSQLHACTQAHMRTARLCMFTPDVRMQDTTPAVPAGLVAIHKPVCMQPCIFISLYICRIRQAAHAEHVHERTSADTCRA